MAREYGYAGKILRVDLSSGRVSEVPTMDYADRFLGGRGIAAKIFWDEVPPETRAFDPENRLIFMTGPLAGVPDTAGSRWQISAKSALMTPEHFCYSNLGGDCGAQLKFSGYDGLIVQGKSDKPVYLFLHDGRAELRDASHLWGKGAIKARGMLKGELGNETKVIGIGPAGENGIIFATILADQDCCGAGGLGAVMGSKGLKAIAVAGTNGRVTVAHPQQFLDLSRYICQLKRGPTWQPRPALPIPKMEYLVCWGCIGCIRWNYKADDGGRGKFICFPSDFFAPFASQYYGKPTDAAYQQSKLCDDYGLDIKLLVPMVTWLARCQKAGILTDENTGVPISQVGSVEFIESLVRQISFREGLGEILAQGVVKAANFLGGAAKEQMADFPILRTGYLTTPYDPRMYITSGLLYMVEPRQPTPAVHRQTEVVKQWTDWLQQKPGAHMSTETMQAIARKFWGSELAVDFSTYEGKALAAKMIQDRYYAQESLILCDSFWPIQELQYTADHIGVSDLESKLVSAVTGRELDEDGLNRLGERVFNLQRAILLREGHHGRQDDTLPEACFTMPFTKETLNLSGRYQNDEGLMPGKDGEPIKKRGTMLDREKFEKVKDEYYALRGWDVISGLPTRAKLSELELEDIARELEARGLIAEGLKVLV